MSMTDPIADLLVRLRNGGQARKEYIECPWSKIKESIVRVLIEEGFVRESSLLENGSKKDLRVWLRYDDLQKPAIRGLRRVSRPSRRVYVASREMPSVRRGMGVNILSTPVGVLADRDAVRRSVGGELLCSVW